MEELSIKWCIVYKDHVHTGLSKVYETESKHKRGFIDTKNNITHMQRLDERENKDPGTGYILSEGIVYEINPSLGHKKITGDKAKEIKRHLKGKKEISFS